MQDTGVSGVLVSPLFAKPTYHPVQRETSRDLASCLLFFISRPFYMPGTGLSPERLLRGTNHSASAHSPTFPAPLNHPSPGRWDRPELYSSLSQKYGQPIFAPALSLSFSATHSLSHSWHRPGTWFSLLSLQFVASPLAS